MAHHLAPYERDGWDGATFLTAAAAALSALRGVTPTVAAAIIEAGPRGGVRSPGGYLHWLATGLGLQIDAFPEDHLSSWTAGDDLVVPDPVEACGRPGCDGLGWALVDVDGAAAKCAHCPPSIRTTSWRDDLDVEPDVADDGAVRVELNPDGTCPF